jgi:hypothetical protein
VPRQGGCPVREALRCTSTIDSYINSEQARTGEGQTHKDEYEEPQYVEALRDPQETHEPLRQSENPPLWKIYLNHAQKARGLAQVLTNPNASPRCPLSICPKNRSFVKLYHLLVYGAKSSFLKEPVL